MVHPTPQDKGQMVTQCPMPRDLNTPRALNTPWGFPAEFPNAPTLVAPAKAPRWPALVLR